MRKRSSKGSAYSRQLSGVGPRRGRDGWQPSRVSVCSWVSDRVPQLPVPTAGISIRWPGRRGGIGITVLARRHWERSPGQMSFSLFFEIKLHPHVSVKTAPPGLVHCWLCGCVSPRASWCHARTSFLQNGGCRHSSIHSTFVSPLRSALWVLGGPSSDPDTCLNALG